MGTSSSEGVSSERGMSRTSSSEEVEEEEERERGREEEERNREMLSPSEWNREAKSGLLGGGAGAGGGDGAGAGGGDGDGAGGGAGARGRGRAGPMRSPQGLIGWALSLWKWPPPAEGRSLLAGWAVSQTWEAGPTYAGDGWLS
ncbi:hypothetical protein SKAU_G00288770 [Synaphobranchus kaupii]|uniref:Uncharacterized protein n=1 Tax=Synaphobranchus kaupii TaxID=118154 RepID=A0A9Q1ILV7_SYNKA|nr:hypothetical protein SKAU_G00288770 [Synaphobranchus kaupii]